MTSGARIPKLEPSSLDDEQRSLYDAIAGGRRARGPQLFQLTDEKGCLEGPFNASAPEAPPAPLDTTPAAVR